MVEKPYRRHGIGEALLDAMIKRLTGAALPIRLDVDIQSVAARCLYEKRGFRVVEVRRSYMFDGLDAFVMELPFEQATKR